MAARLLALILLTGLAAWGLTAGVRRYALQHLLDVPNERSSHAAPTPRGGGLAIVVAFLGALSALALAGQVSGTLYLALAGGGALLAVVGWWDDRSGLPASRRAVAHGVAAAWALYWIRNGHPLDAGLGSAGLNALNAAAAFLEWVGIVWMINLYNFMDGIDGLSASEAVFAGGAAAWLLFASGRPDLGLIAAAGAAASAGFLAWNWPPAKIFMGDVSSGFLGFLFACLAVASVSFGVSSYWPWLVLLGVFEIDATVTLLRRLARRQRVFEAHKSHAFQHASRRWDSHLKVTLGVLALNVLWLLPWTWATWHHAASGPLAFVAALSPLAVLALFLNAGRE